MDAQFKEWLIADSDKWSDAERRGAFHLLKHDPQHMVEIVLENLQHWATHYTDVTNKAVVDSYRRSDAEELVEAYRQHFAAELTGGT